MRTTLMIDEDVLMAARALVRRQSTHVGAVLSDLARRALQHPPGRSAEGLAAPGIKLQRFATGYQLGRFDKGWQVLFCTAYQEDLSETRSHAAA